MPRIKQCIGSIQGQIGAHSGGLISFNHIIQDGQSKDGFDVWMNQFLKSQKSNGIGTIQIFSEHDRGMYDAINRGWEKSDGDILSWLNHDEQYLPGTLNRVNEYFKSNPHIDFVFGNMIIIDPDGNPIAARREIPLREFYIKRDFLYAISCTIFFRRSLYDEKLLSLDPKYQVAGDLDLILKLLQNGKHVGHINEYLSLFCVDGKNLSVTSKDQMKHEVSEIRAAYGGSNARWSTLIVKGLRSMERFLYGCYKKEDLEYLYCLNENSEYQTIKRKNVGYRFSYDRIEILRENET